MSELRAPDPTLTAFLHVEGDCVDVGIADPYDDRPTAHRITDKYKAACGFEWAYTHPAFLARWVAVPCRRCFPDAPPPGQQWSRYVMGRVEPGVKEYLRESPNLRWQVSGGSI